MQGALAATLARSMENHHKMSQIRPIKERGKSPKILTKGSGCAERASERASERTALMFVLRYQPWVQVHSR